MGRRRYPLSDEAVAELRRLAGAPGTPSYRDLTAALYARKLTPNRVDPKILWRACKRLRIKLPARQRSSGEDRQ